VPPQRSPNLTTTLPALDDIPPAWQRTLLATTANVSGELELADVAGRLPATVADIADVHCIGLGIHDAQRQIFRTLIVPAQSATAELNAAESPAEPDSVEKLRQLFATDVDAGGPDWLSAHLTAAGATCYYSAPLLLADKVLGNLFIGFRTRPAQDAELAAYLTALATLFTPVIWNCHTAERFRHGDRRRDTLLELSNAINTSLELDTVLAAAKTALRQLKGHGFSAIDLLRDDGTTFEEHATTATAAAERPLKGTVLEWILKHAQTYQSDDLAQATRFAQDGDLAAHGVRRYVAAPMFVRGRISGCLLMGSVDPHRVLPMDVWLYENIALQLALAIDNARQLDQVRQLSNRLAQQNVYLREEIQSEHADYAMIGESPGLQRVKAAIARVAPTDSTVLIMGETGVGKELVARALHAASPRADQPLVKINCAAIPEGMVESELFGHERGAFTSAVERRIGRFELARDGTLFLDEVGELPLAIQAKLLRVLQDGEFERVGGSKTLTSNARIIAATNRDLLQSVEAKAFRSDLYYRLNVFPIAVPPLRERRDDIPLLASAFIQQIGRRMGRAVQGLDPASAANLMQRHWPGNIRELRHEVERAMILSDGPLLHIAPPTPDQAATTVEPAAAQPVTLETLATIEADYIRQVLDHTNGVVEGPNGAARILGLKPSTLRFRMRRLGVRRPGK
jgi:formate hydrogenlyase transcriptional activator